MEIRKSGKIAIGVIAALGTVGALHMFVFKDNAAKYQAAKAEYDSTEANYRNQGSAPSIDQINRFEYETLRYKLDFWNTTLEMGMYFPDYYRDLTAVDVRLEQRQFWDLLKKLEELRDAGDAGNGPKLTFLTGRWRIVNSLPKPLLDQGISVDDVMTRVRNEDRLLKSLDPQSRVFQDHTRIYSDLLSRLGMVETERDFLKTNFGSLASCLYVLNRIDQVMKNLPEDFWQPGTTESGRLNEMYSLFRLEWPKDAVGGNAYLLYTKQGRELVNLIETAKKHNIREISFVKLHDTRDVHWTDPAKDAEAATAAPAVAAAADFGALGGEFGEFGEFGAEFGGAADGGAGRFGGPAGAAPAPAGELVGVALPIEILTVGDNASTMAYLYEASHARRPVELDRIRLLSDPTPDSPVRALAFFNVIGYPVFAGVLTEEAAAKKINEYTIEMYKLATRAGARELAVKDGIATESNGSYTLVKPMPTPWVDASAPPTPAVDPAAAPPAGEAVQ